MKFKTENLRNGDIGCARTATFFGKGIRAVLGSYTNHNGLFLKFNNRWMMGEAVEPRSRLTTLDELDWNVDIELMRVLRVRSITLAESDKAATYFRENFIGKPYPVSVVRLVWYRFFNNIPWKIKGAWCTRLVWQSLEHARAGILNRPDGKAKVNPTPRTIENRLMAGVLEDVTESVIA